MANEVIIEEYESVGTKFPDGEFAPITGKLVTTQVLTIGTASSAFNAKTSMIRVQSKGTGFWHILGGASPDAVANTAGNRWLPADQCRDLFITPGVDLKLDTAA